MNILKGRYLTWSLSDFQVVERELFTSTNFLNMKTLELQERRGPK